MSQCRHFLVTGSVQGVFYRAATQATARRLGLSGWVRNLPDGNVELLACGEVTKLEALEQWLWQGPPHAQVTQVTATGAGHHAFTDFTISY
jgi:acylphosphatase